MLRVLLLICLPSFSTFVVCIQLFSFAIHAFAPLAGCLARIVYSTRRQAAAALLIQKHVRKWLLHRAFLQIRSAVLIIQSTVRGFSVRQKLMRLKEDRAAILIQVRIIIIGSAVILGAFSFLLLLKRMLRCLVVDSRRCQCAVQD